MSEAIPSTSSGGDGLARRGALALLARVVTVGLAFLLQLVLARNLSVQGYGQYAFAISWMNLLVGFSMLGMDRASLRYPAEYLARGNRSLLSGFLARSQQLGFLGSVTVAVGWLLVALGFRSRMPDGLLSCFLLAGCLVPIMAIAQIRDATLLSVGRIHQGLLGTTLRTGLFLLLALAAIFSGSAISSWLAVGLQLVASLASLLLSSWFLCRWKNSTELEDTPAYETRDWLTVSLPLMAVVLMAFGMNQSGILLTGLLLGTETSGLYAVAVRLCDVALLGYHAVNTVVAPRFASLHATGQTESLQRLLTRCAAATSAVTLGIVALLAVTGPLILSLFGPAFSASYPILLILLAGVAAIAASGPVVYFLNMTGQQQVCLATYTASVALNLCLSLMMIPRWGMIGAALATSMSVAICHLTLVAVVRHKYDLIPHLTLRLPRGSRQAEEQPGATCTPAAVSRPAA